MNRKISLSVIIACVAVGALSGAYNLYYRAYGWPLEIQKGVLGGQVGDVASLLEREGYSAYGEGMFRWRYRVDKGNKRLAALCGNQAIPVCRFTRTRRLDDGVIQSAHYSDGILILEEVWS